MSIPPEMSLLDFFEAKTKEWELDEATSKLVLQMAHMWGDYVGESIETQSLKYFWLEECLDESMLPYMPLFRSTFLTSKREPLRSRHIQVYPRLCCQRSPSRS